MIKVIYDKYSDKYYLSDSEQRPVAILTKSELVGLGIKLLDAAGVPNV